MDKINQLSLGEKLVIGGGIILFLAAIILPWYKVDFEIEGLVSTSFTASGWEAPGAIWSILASLIGLAMAGSILAAKFGNMALPAVGTYSWGQVYLAAGALVVLLLLIKIINESSYMAWGFYIGILSAIALAAGGYLLFTEDKGTGFNFSKSS